MNREETLPYIQGNVGSLVADSSQAAVDIEPHIEAIAERIVSTVEAEHT